MEIYSQRDSRWADREIAGSGVTMGQAGCYITAIAQLLTLADRPTTPLEVLEQLETVQGFTPEGLVIHAKVTEAFPAFHYTDADSTFQIIGGVWGLSGHFMAQKDGAIYDPWFGVENAPKGFIQQTHQNIVIDPLTAPAPAFPYDVEVTAAEGVHVRAEANATSALVGSQFLGCGTRFRVYGIVEGGDPYGNGNTQWYVTHYYDDPTDHYVWSGACTPVSA